jgi:hypothetical protein
MELHPESARPHAAAKRMRRITGVPEPRGQSRGFPSIYDNTSVR